jgi:hypothetical protein
MPAPLPTAWTIDEGTENFIIWDANGHALAYAYCEDENGQRDADEASL